MMKFCSQFGCARVLVAMLVLAILFVVDIGAVYGSDFNDFLTINVDQFVSLEKSTGTNCLGGKCEKCECPGDGRCLRKECPVYTDFMTIDEMQEEAIEQTEEISTPAAEMFFVTHMAAEEAFDTAPTPQQAPAVCANCVEAPSGNYQYQTVSYGGPVRRVFRNRWQSGRGIIGRIRAR